MCVAVQKGLPRDGAKRTVVRVTVVQKGRSYLRDGPTGPSRDGAKRDVVRVTVLRDRHVTSVQKGRSYMRDGPTGPSSDVRPKGTVVYA